ncbi:hypothetical protein ACHAWF_011899 [Thalassiosira exigua]
MAGPAEAAGNYGPVTQLANLAAAREEEARAERVRREREGWRVRAAIAGETAFAIAAAHRTSSFSSTGGGGGARGSPRSSPRRRTKSGGSSGGSVDPSRQQAPSGAEGGGGGASGESTGGSTPPQEKKMMSVAARARMQADEPSPRLKARNRNGGGFNGAAGNPSDESGSPRKPRQQQPAPSSGNAGVARGKFSKEQVRRMVDEWGRSDTSDEEYEEYDDYYGASSDGSDADARAEEEGGPYYQHYKKSLGGHHHLQYTMSTSPGPDFEDEHLAASSPSSRLESEEGEQDFHYQHHRVSAYGRARAATASPRRPRGVAGGEISHSRSEEAGGASDEHSQGLFATARNWLSAQRDRLHQMELERQVDDQRRKLVEEGRRQRALEAERRRASSPPKPSKASFGSPPPRLQHDAADDGPSLGCMSPVRDATAAAASPPPPPAQSEDLQEASAASSGGGGGYATNLCGFGMYEHQNSLADEAEDYAGVPRVDSRGNVLEMIPSYDDDGGAFDGDGGRCERMTVSSPHKTVSGKGMSVQVDLPDGDDGARTRALSDGGEGRGGDGGAEEDDDYDCDEGEGQGQGQGQGQESPLFLAEVKVVPEPPQDDLASSPPILDRTHMRSLLASGGLPPSLSFCKWKRLYSLTRDGDSFEQFLRLVEGHDRTVLVVRSTRGELFGGYADTRWEARHVRQHAFEFYGSAQACLFRFADAGSRGRDGEGDAERVRKVVVYKWSGANRYVQLCDFTRRTVAFGGGGDDGLFGLCIEDDFRRGTTGHCSTFENEPLCEGGCFDVMDLEVWGFTLDF